MAVRTQPNGLNAACVCVDELTFSGLSRSNMTESRTAVCLSGLQGDESIADTADKTQDQQSGLW